MAALLAIGPLAVNTMSATTYSRPPRRSPRGAEPAERDREAERVCQWLRRREPLADEGRAPSVQVVLPRVDCHGQRDVREERRLRLRR